MPKVTVDVNEKLIDEATTLVVLRTGRSMEVMLKITKRRSAVVVKQRS
jgi:hypothetical protein